MKTDPRPDIVLIMTDQHAARIMGCAGDAVALTPNIDALASDGTRFDNCYCPSPLCVPSRMAFLSGLEPHETGVYTNDDYLPSDIPTLAHAMSAAGYDCRLIGRMHFNGPDQHHGFTRRPIGDIGASWPGGAPPDIGPLTKGRGNRGPELEFSGAGATSYQAYDQSVCELAEQELEFLINQRKDSDIPFFAVVSFFCPHPPFIARGHHFDRFKYRVPPPRLPQSDNEHPHLKTWREAGKVSEVSTDAIQRSREAYYGLVAMIDEFAGRILNRVQARENTVSVYTSDHGEALGERGLWWKSTMYDESCKVPLIIRAPDLQKGLVDPRICSLMDLSRTLLGWAETDLPNHKGADLRDNHQWSNQCFASYYGGLINIDLPPVCHRMIRSEIYKMVSFGDDDLLLFDMTEDPDELLNLAQSPEHQSVLEDLRNSLHAGWNVDAIRDETKIKSARRNIIRNWVKTTKPAEPMRWFDPNKKRNRYEN